MLQTKILLPTELKILEEDGNKASFEIDKLYHGYGHTLGNSLRRVILSSIPGVAVTRVFIDGVSHEFSTIEGIKEDVINIVLNLKKIVFSLDSEEPITLTLIKKGIGDVHASDIELPSQVQIMNPDEYLFSISDKNKEVKITFEISKGLGYVAKEELKSGKLKPGEIIMDASFTPVRRASYNVSTTRVGDRTDFNKLTFFIETDGSISPVEVMRTAIDIMIKQFRVILGVNVDNDYDEEEIKNNDKNDSIVSLKISESILEKLAMAGIMKISVLRDKTDEDLLAIDGMEERDLEEIKNVLSKI